MSNQNETNETWTENELRDEWLYVYNERLGLLGYEKGQEPAPEHDRLARDEADAVVAALRGQAG